MLPSPSCCIAGFALYRHLCSALHRRYCHRAVSPWCCIAGFVLYRHSRSVAECCARIAVAIVLPLRTRRRLMPCCLDSPVLGCLLVARNGSALISLTRWASLMPRRIFLIRPQCAWGEQETDLQFFCVGSAGTRAGSTCGTSGKSPRCATSRTAPPSTPSPSASSRWSHGEFWSS